MPRVTGMTRSTHAVVYEDRPARCRAATHRNRWAVCSCGWEACDLGDLHAAVVGHRLSVIEEAIGVTFTFFEERP